MFVGVCHSLVFVICGSFFGFLGVDDDRDDNDHYISKNVQRMPRGTATPMIRPRLVLDESEDEVKPDAATEVERTVPPGMRLEELRSLAKEFASE